MTGILPPVGMARPQPARIRVEFDRLWRALGSPDRPMGSPDWAAYGSGEHRDRMDLPAGEPVAGRAWGELLEAEARGQRRGR